jgi:hypothetical protein
LEAAKGALEAPTFSVGQDVVKRLDAPVHDLAPLGMLRPIVGGQGA